MDEAGSGEAGATAAAALGAAATAASPSTKEQQVETLSSINALASLFSTCVEAFGLILPSRESDHKQKLALAKLGIEQARLLIFGDVVGLSSPPASIATHMIPSHAAITNPDPDLPVYFDVRDPRLDEPGVCATIERTIADIVDRPNHLPREQMMALYGLRPAKRFTPYPQPALDTNRLESFREKYALLQDLCEQLTGSHRPRRGNSMTMQKWSVHDVVRFNRFVENVREKVDGLQELMGCKERIDRAVKSDIRAFAWHPDMNGAAIRRDWEKLKLVVGACQDAYPEYVDIAKAALKHLDDSMMENYKPMVKVEPKATEKEEKKEVKKEEMAKGKDPEKQSSPLHNKENINMKAKVEQEQKEQAQRQQRQHSITASTPSGLAPQSATVTAPERRPSILSRFRRLGNLGRIMSTRSKPSSTETQKEKTQARKSSPPQSPTISKPSSPLTPKISFTLPFSTPSPRPKANDYVARPASAHSPTSKPNEGVGEIDDIDEGQSPLSPVNTTVSGARFGPDIGAELKKIGTGGTADSVIAAGRA